MPNSASHPRFARLQFSLRGLLLCMLLVGVAIVIYRWPWEVATELVDGTPVKTLYRRGWNFQAVQDGLQLVGNREGMAWELWFDEGEIQFQRTWGSGAVTGETKYRGGKKHGPFWGIYGDRGEMHYRGEYRADQQHGEWTYETADRVTRQQWRDGQRHGAWEYQEPDCITREEWRDDERHGPFTWTTPAGRLLQAAEYERGRLVTWNGRPVAEALARWAAENVADPEVRRLLLAPVHDWSEAKGWQGGYGNVEYRVDDSMNPTQPWARLIVNQEKAFAAVETTPWVGSPLGEVLLEEALARSKTLAFRFNMLHLIPITARSLDWQDRTGVYDVQFPPGSEQEKFWLETAEASSLLNDFPGARLKLMFEPDGPGPIAIDVTALQDREVPDLTGGSLMNVPRIHLVRRDLLGQHLNREGCYCEQQGNKIVVFRSAKDESRAQRGFR